MRARVEKVDVLGWNKSDGGFVSGGFFVAAVEVDAAFVVAFPFTFIL